MARVSIANQNVPSQGTFVYSPAVQFFNTRNAVLSDTHVFNPTVVNEFRFGYNRGNSSATATMEREANDFTAKAGLAFGPIFRFPTLNWNSLGQSQVARPSSPASVERRRTTDSRIAFSTPTTWYHPRHLQDRRGHPAVSFRPAPQRSGFGKLLLWFHLRRTPVSRNQGGLPYADFLLGLPTGITNSNAVDWSRQRDLYVGPYVQDDWKVTHRLTPEYRLPLRPVHTASGCEEHGCHVRPMRQTATGGSILQLRARTATREPS